MAKRRLNNTRALAGEPSGEIDHSVSVRKIENGFVIRQSSYNPGTGECKSSESFSASAPSIRAPGIVRSQGVSPDEGNSLRGAVDYLASRGRGE